MEYGYTFLESCQKPNESTNFIAFPFTSFSERLNNWRHCNKTSKPAANCI